MSSRRRKKVNLISTLPQELLQEIIMNLPNSVESVKTILSLCSVNRELCQREAFWRELYQRKTGLISRVKGSWKYQFISLYLHKITDDNTIRQVAMKYINSATGPPGPYNRDRYISQIVTHVYSVLGNGNIIQIGDAFYAIPGQIINIEFKQLITTIYHLTNKGLHGYVKTIIETDIIPGVISVFDMWRAYYYPNRHDNKLGQYDRRPYNGYDFIEMNLSYFNKEQSYQDKYYVPTGKETVEDVLKLFAKLSWPVSHRLH